MKSIQNQYNDLKEGKMSQTNFMRNLRMTMPQYVTNITSFQDSVRILKNKGIITESMAKANYEDPITLAKAIATTHPELQRFALEDRNMFQRAAFKYAAELMKSAGLSNTVQMNLINGYADEDWPSDFISALGDALESGAISENNNPEEEIIDEMNMEVKPEESNDAEFDAILKQLEDEIAGEIAVKSDVLDEPFEEMEGSTSDTSAIEKAIKDKKIDPAKVKAAAEKAMRGDSTDLALLMVNTGGLSEGKGKELHPNLIHPGELRMGIRVEMEHTDDIEKAKKIALDHIAENPYYYTALKLSGIESPTKPKEKAKKEVKSRKKKETVELIDKANQMQKVKMPKTVKEALEQQPKQDSPSVRRVIDLIQKNSALDTEFDRLDTEVEIYEFLKRFFNSILDPTNATQDEKLRAFSRAITDFRKQKSSSKVASKVFSSPQQTGLSKSFEKGELGEAEQPTEDKIEMELSAALDANPTIKRYLKTVDLASEITGPIQALLDRTNLKNIPDPVVMAAVKKILDRDPSPSFTSQLAANANIGGPNPKLGKTLKEELRLMVREVLAEESSSKKNAASEITAKAINYIDEYNEGESKEYKKSQLENVFDSYEDKVGRRFDDSVFEDVIDMLKAKGYTMTMKETFDGRDNLTNISDDTQ